MPAGDQVVADYQVELGGVLIGGAGGMSSIAPPGIVGLGKPTPKSADVPLQLADGAYGAPDWADVRTVTVPILIDGTTAAAAWNAFATISAAWGPSTVDVQLYLRLPGLGRVYLVGRPRGLAEDLSLLPEGIVNCLGTFVALKPAMVAA